MQTVSEPVPAPVPHLLRVGTSPLRVAPPCVLVIFGASGDLTSRKLVPALYNLELAGFLPSEFAGVGVSRDPVDDGMFREQLRRAAERCSRSAPLHPGIWESFASRVTYLSGDLADPVIYQELRRRLAGLDREARTAGNRWYYLATPPRLFAPIVGRLGEAELNRGGTADAFARLIVEKLFGRDLTSARQLSHAVWTVFNENQIFRIDHDLGKETVQNVLAFRFANRLWEPVWNAQHVDHVQITGAESIGVESRAGYDEEAGALRDMVENHVLQLLALVAMEPPVTFEANAVRDEKVKVLKALRRYSADEVAGCTVRGQYDAGWSEGQPVPAYRSEPGVHPDRTTETFVALRLLIDNWRWAGTPFSLRHGKRLPKRVTEIAVQFKSVPRLPFATGDVTGLEPDVLVLRIQPDEGITLRFGAKVPGLGMQLRSVNMDFLYDAAFVSESPDADERLLLDCLQGDHTLFTRADGVEAGWTFATPILDAWRAGGGVPFGYPAGDWGPIAAEDLLTRDGRRWRRL